MPGRAGVPTYSHNDIKYYGVYRINGIYKHAYYDPSSFWDRSFISLQEAEQHAQALNTEDIVRFPYKYVVHPENKCGEYENETY